MPLVTNPDSTRCRCFSCGTSVSDLIEDAIAAFLHALFGRRRSQTCAARRIHGVPRARSLAQSGGDRPSRSSRNPRIGGWSVCLHRGPQRSATGGIRGCSQDKELRRQSVIDEALELAEEFAGDEIGTRSSTAFWTPCGANRRVPTARSPGFPAQPSEYSEPLLHCHEQLRRDGDAARKSVRGLPFAKPSSRLIQLRYSQSA